ETVSSHCQMFGPPGTDFTAGAFKAADEWLNGRAQTNINDFMRVAAEEIKYNSSKIQKLIGENEEQRKFIEDELPGLTVDGLRRAEQCRARERIARLARILCHAASAGAKDGADSIEDMMAVAIRLSEQDVLILSHSANEYDIETKAHPQEAER